MSCPGFPVAWRGPGPTWLFGTRIATGNTPIRVPTVMMDARPALAPAGSTDDATTQGLKG